MVLLWYHHQANIISCPAHSTPCYDTDTFLCRRLCLDITQRSADVPLPCPADLVPLTTSPFQAIRAVEAGRIKPSQTTRLLSCPNPPALWLTSATYY
jgi:hypothetical protein